LRTDEFGPVHITLSTSHEASLLHIHTIPIYRATAGC